MDHWYGPAMSGTLLAAQWGDVSSWVSAIATVFALVFALLAAGIAFNRNLRAFRMAAAGSGQEAAGIAVAGPMALHAAQLPEGMVIEQTSLPAGDDVPGAPDAMRVGGCHHGL